MRLAVWPTPRETDHVNAEFIKENCDRRDRSTCALDDWGNAEQPRERLIGRPIDRILSIEQVRLGPTLDSADVDRRPCGTMLLDVRLE